MKNRTPLELESSALMYWPSTLTAKEKEVSVLPLLLETQDKFISLLNLADSSPTAWKEAIKTTHTLRPNVFLKHLMVLADLGGEPLNRVKKDLRHIFPNEQMPYIWRDKQYTYTFKTITTAAWNNKKLAVDGKGLFQDVNLLPEIEDAAMFLLHGGTCTLPNMKELILEKCVIGSLIGDEPQLTKFVKQRYIWVSKILTGATANTLGQLAQDYVKEKLTSLLPNWKFTRNGSIPGMSQNQGNTDMSFDVVAQSPEKRYFAIEVSFQFTTNSVIERKAGQALARQTLLHGQGHHITYVIDGAGNFQRASAIRTICDNSDFTVSFKDEELTALAEYLRTTAKSQT